MDIGELVKRCIRIFYVSRKPTDDEFRKVAKVTGFGMIVIGLIGFLIAILLSIR